MLFLALALGLLALGIDHLHNDGYSFNGLILVIAAAAIVLFALIEVIVGIVKDEWPSK